MSQYPIEPPPKEGNAAINIEEFNTALHLSSDDVVRVVNPSGHATGKGPIGDGYKAMAAHINDTLHAPSADMRIADAGDTALVAGKAIIFVCGVRDMEGNAT